MIIVHSELALAIIRQRVSRQSVIVWKNAEIATEWKCTCAMCTLSQSSILLKNGYINLLNDYIPYKAGYTNLLTMQWLHKSTYHSLAPFVLW